MLLPTTLVGSYPQPDWLIDRASLAKQMPPRVRARELWRVAPEQLEAAQDDATLLAIRDQERAGLDIITDGEQRRESYSNRFATALDGVDIDNPGKTPNRTGGFAIVPRIVGPIRRRHPVEVRDVAVPARQHRPHDQDDGAGPVHHGAAVRGRVLQRRGGAGARLRGGASTPRSRTCSRPAPTSCSSTIPGCRRGRRRRSAYGLKALDRALEGVTGTTAVHLCFGYAQMVKAKPSGYSFLPELERSAAQQISIEAAQPKLDLAVLKELPSKTIILGVIDLSDHDVETPETVAARIRAALPYVPRRADRRCARLRHEISPARGRLRQDAGDGGRRRDRAASELSSCASLS